MIMIELSSIPALYLRRKDEGGHYDRSLWQIEPTELALSLHIHVSCPQLPSCRLFRGGLPPDGLRSNSEHKTHIGFAGN